MKRQLQVVTALGGTASLYMCAVIVQALRAGDWGWAVVLYAWAVAMAVSTLATGIAAGRAR
jgi:hypothetical protein